MSTDTENKIVLDIDWDALLPGKIFKIGGKSITIRPLELAQISLITKKIEPLLPKIKEAFNKNRDSELDNLLFFIEIVTIIMDEAPDIISDFTNIATESIEKLPIDYLMCLLDVAIEANIESKDYFLKNFASLAEKLVTIFNLKETDQEQKKKQSKA